MSQHPITIQADKVLFNLEPITDITAVPYIQCQMAKCTDDNNMTKETTDNIKKLTAMTKLEAEQNGRICKSTQTISKFICTQ